MLAPPLEARGEAEGLGVVAAVEAAGGRAVLTDPDLPSGSDRILAALRILDPDGRHDVVINLQGDIPFIAPEAIQACAGLLSERPEADISTVMVAESDPSDRVNPDMPKVVAAMAPDGRSARALYFTRSVLYGEGPVWIHHGIYGYRRQALERFTAAPPSPLERRERLEQLRALEMGMVIWSAVLDEAPISVDNPSDLERARAHARRMGDPA